MNTADTARSANPITEMGITSEVLISSPKKKVSSINTNSVSTEVYIESLSHINPNKKAIERYKLIEVSKHTDDYKGGNEATLNLYKLGLGLNILAGIILWYRYDSAIAFLIITSLYVLSNIGLNKIPNIRFRNILLGMVNVALSLSVLIPV
jgi:hypothetical protein